MQASSLYFILVLLFELQALSPVGDLLSQPVAQSTGEREALPRETRGSRSPKKGTRGSRSPERCQVGNPWGARAQRELSILRGRPGCQRAQREVLRVQEPGEGIRGANIR